MRRAGLGVLGCLVGAGLIASGVSPVWAAAKPQSAGESAVVGGFGLGDGLEAAVDEQSGSFGFGLPAGGVDLGWDSRAVGVDRHGLGGGWGFGLAFVQVDGGVVVFPAGGGAYPADASAPTGLAGYTLGDARFEQTPGGVLPARVDGTRGDVAYAYVLHELGGSTTYFSAAGDPIAAVTATGLREDWSWQAGDLHRLVELIDTDGVVTSVAWRDATGEFDVRPGANLPERGAAWTVRLVHGAVAGVVSPDGTRTQVRTDESGLVTEVAGPSGARTDVRWRAHLDGVARVERVRTIDGGGAEVSARTWRPVDDVQSPSGWPATEVAAGRPGTGSVFSSVIGDGRTEVESTYNMLGSLIRRVTSGTSGSGRAELKAQTFQYPATDDAGRPTVQLDELPKHWASPTIATATTYNAEGARRDATLHTEFDEHGRLIRDLEGTTYAYDTANRVIEQTTTDGTTTRTEYWSDGSRKQLTTIDANGDEATSAFYWAGDTLLNDTHTGIGETGTASYLFGTTRQARTVTVGDGERTEHDTSYLGTDRHSNTTELTDEHGDVTTRYAYSDYGTTTVTDATGEQPVADAVVGDATRNPIQFASGYTDPSGRQHLDARDYDSVTMRFDTPDHAAMLTNYAFAGLNPIMKVDPSGRAEIGDAIINGALAAVGLGSAAWTVSQIGAPSLAALGPAGLFWWSVAFVAVIGDFVSTGIAVAELVHDGGTRFIRDQDREALTISGIVIGAVAAALGPIATSLKNHFKAAHARRSALADPLSDSDAEDLVKSKSDSDSSSSDTVDFEDEVEVIAPKTKYTGTADHDVFAQFVTETETNITALGKRFEGRVELITLTRLLRKPPLRHDGTQLTQRMVWHCYVSDESKLLDTISEKLSSNQPVLPEHQAAITNITDDIAAMRLHFQ
jgi:RHS repeat-associated protein